MAWIKERITDDGDKRFVACYRDPEGRQRSAGTYSSRRAAERAANREEAKVRDGRLARPLPRPGHLRRLRRDRLAALQARRDLHPGRLPVLPRQALHPHLRTQADGQDPAHRDPTLGHHRHHHDGKGLSAASRPEVPHHAALGLRTRPARPGGHLQPLRPHRAPQGDQEEGPDPDPRRVRRHPRRPPRPASADGRDRHQHRPPVGRAHRPQAPPPRPHQAHADRRRDSRRGLDQELPHRRPDAHQALPQGQRTPHHGLPADLVDQLAAHITDPPASVPTTCCSPPATAPRSPATPSAPASGCPPSKPPASTSTSASTTSATPTPPGCSPAAPTSSP